MKESIKNNIHNPAVLEQLYQTNKALFRKEFHLIYDEIKGNPIAQVWHERICFKKESISWGSRKECMFVIISCLLAGLLAKLPKLIGIEEEYFYQRNIGFITFPLLMAYFIWKQQKWNTNMLIHSISVVISVFFINILPDNKISDTLTLACMHLPLFLWSLVGFSFLGKEYKDYKKRLEFLRYNGDLAIMITIIMITGFIVARITFLLFLYIDIKIDDFYFQYVIVFGLASAPIIGTHLVQTNPQLVNKVSPVIAKVFTPFVFLTLVVYVFSIIITGKDPYKEREFLLVFNVLLIGVMALILFSISETSRNYSNNIEIILLFGLSLVTVIVNGIALSAIVLRISEWGITPNRIAVLGENILILAHILMVSYKLFQTINNKKQIENVERSIAVFLPFYTVWCIIVVFVFPVLFGFK
ncbi:MAG: hypothetical protein QM536_06990 [Chitinophagaceae bacterium]|nr:hypothetical protein [Chitinophagaceae bacterium]